MKKRNTLNRTFGIMLCLLLGGCNQATTTHANGSKEQFPDTYVLHGLPLLPKDQRYDQASLNELMNAEISESQQRPDIAMPNYLALAEQTTDLSVIKRGLAISLADKDYRYALAFTLRWLEIDPNNKQIKTLASAILQQQPDLALDLVSVALKTQPNDMQLLYAQSILAIKFHKLSLAEQDLHHIITINPNDGRALNALGFILVDENKNLDEAANYLQHAMLLSPNNAQVIDSMGWLQYRLGHYADAKTYLTRAWNIHNDSVIAQHLITVLIASGDLTGAQNMWQVANKKFPHDVALQDFAKHFSQVNATGGE